VRNPAMVAFARHCGLTLHTCEPADPASKGGSESTVKIAKADLVPKATNVLEEYASFAELEAACAAFCTQVNARVHRVTLRAPVDMLAEERTRLHPLPAHAHTVAFGVTRTVAARTAMVAFDGGSYSVPHALLGQTVWVRVHGRGEHEQVILVHVGADGPVEVARHARATRGSPRANDDHFPPTRPGRGVGSATEGPQHLRARVSRLGGRCPFAVDRGRHRRHDQDAGEDGPGGDLVEAVQFDRGGLGVGPRRGPCPLRAD
jgi:hypothetical protein